MKELDKNELLEINGGGWVGDALRAVRDALVDAWEWCKDHVRIVPM